MAVPAALLEQEALLSHFTPGQMSAEMLEYLLVRRHRLIERLVRNVRDSVLTAAKHQDLLIGPRGIGKSYLVALAYHRVKALPELEGKIAIAWLAEEEWGVASLADFFLVVLKALEKEYGGLQERIDALYRLPIERIAEAAFALIREFVGTRTLFVLIENLEEIFRGLNDKEQWALRSYISERPFITLLATTQSLFPGVTKRGLAFHGFFQNIYLDELTVDEATELLGKVAELRKEDELAAFLKSPTAKERVQALHDLAGGHPRIYLFFAHLLTEEGLDELVRPFLKLLDELTPYYQSRMQSLSPQQRKIVEFLCDRRGAVQVKDIAAQNLMTPNTASGQMDKLEAMGYVRKTPAGRDSYYELREPLLRLVIEVKRGRGEPVRLIVDFLRRWYDRSERKEWLAEVAPDTPLTRQYLQSSLDLNLAVQDAPDLKRAERFSTEYASLVRTGQYERACEVAEEIIEKKGRDCEADDWFQYGWCLAQAGRYREALKVREKVIQPTFALSVTKPAPGLLGEGLAESIPAMLQERVSQDVAEEWLEAWRTEGRGRPELEIPLRLLGAAVEWKRTRSVRALLALPIEERRILESLLPKDANESGGDT